MSNFEHGITRWDRDAFQTINEGLKSPAFDQILPHISDLGLGYIQVPFILALGVIVALRRREIVRGSFPYDTWRAIVGRRWVLTLLLAFAIGGIGSILFKETFSRDRPYWYYYHEHQAGRAMGIRVELATGRRPLKTRGFVSGHTATSFAIMTAATGLYWRRKGFRAAVVGGWILAGLIGLSRIYIGDHWPLDVICGAIVGVCGGTAAVLLMRPKQKTAEDVSATARDAHDSRDAPSVPNVLDAPNG